MKILIEKPVFIKSSEFDKFIKYKNNIFVGYNRIYYKGVDELKKIILKEQPNTISIQCPELNKKNIELNTCHVISILYYLFGSITLIKKLKNKNGIFCIFKSKKNIPIFINISFGSPDNFSFELSFAKHRAILKPIEILTVYNKLNRTKYKNYNVYEPNILKQINEHKETNLKPGFNEQYSNFKSFLQNKKAKYLNIQDSKEIILICNKISN